MDRVLRRAAAAAAIVVVAVLAAPTGAGATDLPVSGSLSGRSDIIGQPCGFLGQTIDMAGDLTSLGPSNLHVLLCVSGPSEPNHWPIDSGTFELTTADGALSGDVAGFVEPEVEPFGAHVEMAVTAGTGTFAGATGSLVLDAVLTLTPDGSLLAEGTIAGVISPPPPVARTVDDCKDGRWQDHVDDQGRPFRNQGECIAFVIHH